MEHANADFKQHFLQLMQASHDAKGINELMSYISISTITIICDLSDEIDIKALNDNFIGPCHPVCFMKKTKAHDEYEVTKRGKTKKSFYNQITIQYQDVTTKSIKVFSNGRLQMTGMTSMYDAIKAAGVLCDIVTKTPFATKSLNIHPVEMHIAMINSNFSFNSGLHILSIKDDLGSHDDIHVQYDPEVYPGLKIKQKMDDGSFCSLFVFSTGNVVITGVKKLEYTLKAFNTITTLINSNLNKYKSKYQAAQSSRRASKLRSHEFIHGYPKYLYQSCLAS